MEKKNAWIYLAQEMNCEWNNLEIHPVRYVGDDIERCEEGKEDFWTVYARRPFGEVNVLDAIADFKTKAQADRFSRLLFELIVNFKEK